MSSRDDGRLRADTLDRTFRDVLATARHGTRAALSRGMRTLAWLSLLAAFSLAFVPRASADGPEVIARDDGTEVNGLPAISGDGHTVAVLRRVTDRSDAERIAVAFLDARTGADMGEWLILERDDQQHLLPLPADERGDTPWRRARNLTLHFAARGFRPLVPMVGEFESGMAEGAGLTLVQQQADDDVVVTDASGRERLRVHLPSMTAFCGMSDDAPYQAAPLVRAALVDVRSRTLLLTYGHVYVSCMCDDDIETDVLRLAR